jgi:negative regulator of replication initiation
MARTTVTFTDTQYAYLQAEAKRIGVSVGDLVRRIIDAWREAKGA